MIHQIIHDVIKCGRAIGGRAEAGERILAPVFSLGRPILLMHSYQLPTFHLTFLTAVGGPGLLVLLGAPDTLMKAYQASICMQ